jgi:MFS family permease
VTFVLIYGAYLSYFPFVLERSFGLSELWIGLVMASTSISTAFGAFGLGRLARRFGERRLIVTGYALYVVALAAIPFARWLPLLLVAILVFGFANGITIPSILAILSRIAPPELRAVFMSVNGMVLCLGQTLGPILAGAVYAAFGIEATFWVSAILAAGMLAALATTGSRDVRLAG